MKSQVKPFIQKKKISHQLKRLVQKIGIKLTRFSDPSVDKDPREASELETAMLFRRMIKYPDSELLTSPISNNFYVKNDTLNILIIMTDCDITIINHIFGYHVQISKKTFRNLYAIFANKIEERRNSMELEYKNNIKHSIQTIIKRIDETGKYQ